MTHGSAASGSATPTGATRGTAPGRPPVTTGTAPSIMTGWSGGPGSRQNGNGRPEPSVDVPIEHWRAVQDINLSATFLVLKAFLPAMIAARKGSIVTMASSAARHAGQSSAAYAAAKAGVVALTRHLANELGPSGVRLNCLAPSAIETGDLARQPQEMREKIAQYFPLRRLGTPRDVSDAALFLLSDAASWITGVTLDVNGGRLMI